MIPLYTANQVKEADEFAIKSLNFPSIVLMENAARSIFSLLKETYSIQGKRIAVIVGKGNNGGDGLALARHLIINEIHVDIILVEDEKLLSPDSKINYEILKRLINYYPKCTISKFSNNSYKIIRKADLIIDALFGTGISGQIREPYKSIIDFVNQLNAIKIAIDIPSGLNANTGFTETAFHADLTITLAGLKRGLFVNDGKFYSGVVKKGSIGIGDEYFNSLQVSDFLIEPEDIVSSIPKRKINDNKYSTGKVLVIAGSKEFIGAAILSANSAIKSGSGAVVVACPASLRSLFQKRLLEPTIFAYDDSGKGYLQKDSLAQIMQKINWADSVVIGPGLGREAETTEAVRELLKKVKNKKIIIDADGIYALNKKYNDYNLKDVVLTPHHKEFADLLGINLTELKNDILYWGKNFSTSSKSYLVLKGSPTIIFTPTGDALVNSTGNPGMAKFGVGDVLAGMLASFVSKSKNLEMSISAAVYIHSLSADLLNIKKHELTYTAKNIIENLTYAFKFISKSALQKDY